jgi:nucleoside diphosphate kinase
MPFALVPDGFELKKVTKLQKDAVDKFYRHENVKALINNPEIIKQIIITGVAFLVAREGKDALKELKDLGASIPKTVEDAFTEKRTFGTSAPVGVSFEDIVDEGLKRLSNLI